ncbi:Hypothetical protein CAP_1294 [Chondromyces apiculatus DSM 436]|uniref:Uncharacterized protein n=1 Tax=Chondromyces apiculatus DSM 436 TaxID=1192034 RepID=A0A017TE20_9BACT|nr:Hypothetical protein CAP_1294 [Chondromyces apiculatus DSM 436]
MTGHAVSRSGAFAMSAAPFATETSLHVPIGRSAGDTLDSVGDVHTHGRRAP